MRRRLAGVIALFGLMCAAAEDYRSASPFPVEDKAQLFVDRVLVRDTDNVAFTLHPARKHPANPIVKADRPWEGWRLEIYGNVIRDEDEGIFKMWYLGEENEAFPHYAVYYATSVDGVHWDKPPVGTVQTPKYEKHNVIAGDIILPSVIKDKNDPNPARRYKMIGWDQKRHAYHTWTSPDGLNWSPLSREPLCRSGDVITGYYDEQRKLYVAFPKIGYSVRGHDRRVFWLITSADFETWTEPELVITPDLRDDASSLARLEEVRPILDVPDDPALMRTEFYGVGAYPAESCTIAFLWMLTINNNARYGNQEGPGELQLAVSRDLRNWERPFRTPCVPRGKLDEWDRGFFVTQSRALRVGDEIWLYYGGSTYTHGTPCLYRAENTGRHTEQTGSIGLAIWPLDRFVSADAPPEGGALTTIPVVFTGDRLELNAAVKEGGSIVVQLADAAGKPLEGYHASESIHGDSLRHVVRWNAAINVSPLAGTPVSIRFNMRSAELYSFAFREGNAPS
ncbi:MAG: hypothetical protein HUU46_09405 [Candidatus Hydrogenedentes bacterium]|nr:hypothetical protein [Candidatus Hydrogenedentota bacterium]